MGAWHDYCRHGRTAGHGGRLALTGRYAGRVFVQTAAALLCGLLLAGPASAGSWSTQGAGVTSYDLRDVDAVSLTAASAAGDFGRVLQTANGGTSWTEYTPALIGHFQGVAFFDTGHGLAVGGGGKIYANDGVPGVWTSMTSGISSDLYGVAYADSAQNACAVGAGGAIRRTANGGASWGAVDSTTTATLRAVAFDSTGANGVAVGDGGVIVRSVDGGVTWATVTSGVAVDLKDVTFASSTNGWAVGCYDTILFTDDGGATWSPVTHTGTGDNLNGVSAPDTSRVWAVGDNGTVLFTRDAGTTWTVTPSVPTTRDLFAVGFADAGHGWAVGCRGTIVKYVYEQPAVAITGNDGAWHTPPVTLTFTATVDPDLSVSTMEYSTDGGSTWASVPGSGAVRTLAVSTQGVTTVQARCSDSAAQTGPVAQTVARVDGTQPAVSCSGVPASWVSTPVVLTLTGTCGPSGIASVQYRVDGGAWQTASGSGTVYAATIAGNGLHTVACKATSNAGMVSAVNSVSVPIDDVTPVVTAHGVPAGWSPKAVGIHFHATHGPSGIAAVRYQVNGGDWHSASGSGSDYYHTISSKGVHAVNYFATTNSGATSAVGSVNVRIDTAVPVATAGQKPLANKYGYNRDTVNVILRKKGLGPSGGFLYYRVGRNGPFLKYKTTIPVEADGLTKVYYYAQSGAGLKSKTKTCTLHIDSTIPVSDVLNDLVRAKTGSYARLTYRIEDDFSPKAKVQLVIYHGSKESRMNLGLVPTNKDLSCRIRTATVEGAYEFTFYAMNLAGTPDPMPSRGTLMLIR
jgi:photosystem II stability/assembly factor-like uncharacterized protein